MTLKEMSTDYWTQADRIQVRLAELREERKGTGDPREQLALDQRMRPLRILLRETKDQADLLEHYYDRGYYRDARYTL